MIRATEYAALPPEFASATPALIIKAKKFVKKITRQPFREPEEREEEGSTRLCVRGV